MLDAYISELMVWPAVSLIVLVYAYLKNRFKKIFNPEIKRLIFLSVLSFLVYLFLPHDNTYQGMVLSVRYIFHIFALVSLIILTISQKVNIQFEISLLLLLNFIVFMIHPYQPKLLFIMLPVAICILLLLR
jgi:hypothetical protein